MPNEELDLAKLQKADSFVGAEGYAFHGRHEIYLSDPGRYPGATPLPLFRSDPR